MPSLKKSEGVVFRRLFPNDGIAGPESQAQAHAGPQTVVVVVVVVVVRGGGGGGGGTFPLWPWPWPCCGWDCGWDYEDGRHLIHCTQTWPRKISKQGQNKPFHGQFIALLSSSAILSSLLAQPHQDNECNNQEDEASCYASHN